MRCFRSNQMKNHRSRDLRLPPALLGLLLLLAVALAIIFVLAAQLVQTA